ncbi:hypothetical protein ACLOJK_031070 [Asimina triloba]
MLIIGPHLNEVFGLLLASLFSNINSMAEDHEVAVDQVDDALPAVAQVFFVGGTTTTNTGNKWLKGRKLAKKAYGVKGEAVDADPAERKILKPIVGRKLIDTDVIAKKANISKGGLVAFNSDYCVPRPHPPKNN